MEKVCILVNVSGGVADAVAPDFCEVIVIDHDNIAAGDSPRVLPDTAAWRALAARAGLGDEFFCRRRRA